MSGYFLRLLARAAAAPGERAALGCDVVEGEREVAVASPDVATQRALTPATEGASKVPNHVAATETQPVKEAVSPVTPLMQAARVDLRDGVQPKPAAIGSPLDAAQHLPAASPSEARSTAAMTAGRADGYPAKPVKPIGPLMNEAVAGPPTAEAGTSAATAVRYPERLLARSPTQPRAVAAKTAEPRTALPATIVEQTPDVHITIGRIEVIASPPPASVAAPVPSSAPKHAPQSLDAYLAQKARTR